MSESNVRLTKRVVDSLPFATREQKQYVVRDAVVRGFYVLVGQRTKSYYLQGDPKIEGVRKQIQRKLTALDGDPDPTVDEARDAALSLKTQWKRGIDPKREEEKQREQAAAQAAAEQAERAADITLADAWDSFREIERAPKTQARYDQLMRVYLATWMHRPLRSISKQEVRERHRDLAREIAAGKYAKRVPANRKQRRGTEGRERPQAGGIIAPKNRSGHSTANDVFRLFRAIYADAVRGQDDKQPPLPADPCVALKRRWFKTSSPKTAIPLETLPVWWRGVAAIANPVRRDLLRVLLLTGLRRESACEMRWEHIDFKAATLLIPKPKGGEERAFTIPLSTYLVALLQERKADNARLVAAGELPPDNESWVFPSWSESGHVAEPREDIAGVSYTVHDLRRTFITQAEALDISVYACKALVNHSQPGQDVTGGYIRLTTERLRGPMQKITDHLLRVCEGGSANVVPLRAAADAGA